MRTYIKSESVVVYKTTEQWGGLSNMAAGFPLQVNNVKILTAEALYQACRFPHLPEIQKEIIGQYSPMIAKIKTKPYRQDSRADWDDVRYKIMRWCLRVKLAQHYESFGELLLATKDKPIVELSRKDDYWGAKSDLSEDVLVGENVLGRLLMELREKLKMDFSKKLVSVEPMAIDNFLLFGKPIGKITDADLTKSAQIKLI
jgi:ribA/ribD-fused uncharacterized protein